MWLQTKGLDQCGLRFWPRRIFILHPRLCFSFFFFFFGTCLFRLNTILQTVCPLASGLFTQLRVNYVVLISGCFDANGGCSVGGAGARRDPNVQASLKDAFCPWGCFYRMVLRDGGNFTICEGGSFFNQAPGGFFFLSRFCPHHFNNDPSKSYSNLKLPVSLSLSLKLNSFYECIVFKCGCVVINSLILPWSLLQFVP